MLSTKQKNLKINSLEEENNDNYNDMPKIDDFDCYSVHTADNSVVQNDNETIIITNKISPLKNSNLSSKEYEIGLSAIKKKDNKNDISDTSILIRGLNGDKQRNSYVEKDIDKPA